MLLLVAIFGELDRMCFQDDYKRLVNHPSILIYLEFCKWVNMLFVVWSVIVHLAKYFTKIFVR